MESCKFALQVWSYIFNFNFISVGSDVILSYSIDKNTTGAAKMLLTLELKNTRPFDFNVLYNHFYFDGTHYLKQG